MEEVRQAWKASLKAVRSSTLSNNASNNTNENSTTIWYDLPAPVIIHCRDFRDDEEIESAERIETGNEKKAVDSLPPEERIYENSPRNSCGSCRKDPTHSTSDTSSDRSAKHVEEVEKVQTLKVLRKDSDENHEDVSSSETFDEKSSKDIVRVPRMDSNRSLREVEMSDSRKENNSDVREKKHRNTVELTAITSVKTDDDGIPTISFSFLQTSEKNIRRGASPQEERSPREDHLYDFPKNSYPRVEEADVAGKHLKPLNGDEQSGNKEEAGSQVENERRDTKEQKNSTVEERNKKDVKNSTKTDTKMGVDSNGKKEMKGSAEKGKEEEEVEEEEEEEGAMIEPSSGRLEEKHRGDRRKRSVRSLKSLRRNYEEKSRVNATSYSDPECSNDESSSASRYGDRLKSEKRRLRKAWFKMRSWIRDETTRFNEILVKHARMQAVGAVNEDAPAIVPKISKKSRGSYDLRKARVQSTGSITRVEEFGLNCVSEEENDDPLEVDRKVRSRLENSGSVTRISEFGVRCALEENDERNVRETLPEDSASKVEEIQKNERGIRSKDVSEIDSSGLTRKTRSSEDIVMKVEEVKATSSCRQEDLTILPENNVELREGSLRRRALSSDNVLADSMDELLSKGEKDGTSEQRRSADGESKLRRKTASTEEIFSEESKARVPPAAFSMEKLCSDTENEEKERSRERRRKGGLIKRRMLGSIRGLMASTNLLQAQENEEGGPGGFEDVRRYVKQGGDFCKELAAILNERAELEATYAKGLSKLSSKLTKACAKDQGGNSSGGVTEAWRCVGEEMEAAAEAHRIWGIALSEQLAKPLRVGVAEAQGRSRKTIENSVDKAGKSLQEWRGVATKSKKQSFACARENERLQDLARLQSISQSQQTNNKSSNHQMTEKEASKLETRRRKAEDSSRRADTEFYTVSVRAERARLEYESTVRKGAKQMELLEEERLSALKDLANVYLAHLQALAPRLQQSADRLSNPVRNCSVSQDVEILKNLIRRLDSNDVCNSEQLLPDFYAEHVTLAMNRERRKQALVRVLHLIRQDLERERRGREGLETLHRAFIKTPAFAADESTQNVTDKLHHMRSMLLYLEAARYKVGGTLAEVEGSKRGKHPLAEHILVSRDKQGLQQSVLKIPSWAKNESFELPDSEDEIDEHLGKEHETESRHWADRTAGDGNSENPPDEDDFSDFDEFSSHSEDNNNQEIDVAEATNKSEGAEQCRAIYQYSANLNDELSLSPGDLITVHQKQADGWWIGECRGRTGIFPATYVQVIH